MTRADGLTAPSGARLALLTAIAIVLVVTTFTIPESVATWATGGTGASIDVLSQLVSHGLDSWVIATPLASEAPADLAVATNFWRAFHVTKAVLSIAAVLVATLVMGRLSARFRLVAEARLRVFLGFGMLFGASVTAVLLLVAVANVQGSVAPQSSALTFLPAAHPTPAMTSLSAQLASGVLTPSATALLEDFRMYHWAVVVLGGALVVGLVGVAVRAWQSRVTSPRLSKRDLVVMEVFLAAGVVGMGLVLVANLSTALEPTAPFEAFLAGGG